MYHLRLKLDEAQRFIAEHHRHSAPLKRHKFSIGCLKEAKTWCEKDLLGVCTVDTPSSHRYSQMRNVVEVRRLCTIRDDNVGSFLLGKACTACFAMGFKAVISYTQLHELGTCYRAAGFFINGHSLQSRLYQWLRIEGPVTQEQMEQTAEHIDEVLYPIEWQGSDANY